MEVILLETDHEGWIHFYQVVGNSVEYTEDSGHIKKKKKCGDQGFNSVV